MSSSSSGRAKICCISKKELKDSNGESFSFEKNRIEEIWNSSELKSVREKMLKGEKLPECQQCYEEEALGAFSMRIGFNQKWFWQEKESLLQRVAESRENAFVLNSRPWYYDLKQGNLCNLKCRSCGPVNSSSIEKEYHEIANTNAWFKNHVGPLQLDDSYHNWFLNEEFNEQLMAEIPNLKMLYFTGGEPTLIEKNLVLLQHCVATGHAQHIDLLFNTNCTHLTRKFVEIVKNFKHVMLNLSIDGYGIEQEYLRGNSKWALIETNLAELSSLEASNFRLNLTPVLQACNILTIDKLFYYVEELNSRCKRTIFHFLPIILTQPSYLAVSILPKDLRVLAIKRLQDYMAQSNLVATDQNFNSRLLQIISRLKEDVTSDPHLIEVFVRSTQVLDEHRKQKFASAFPELYEKWFATSAKMFR